MSLGRPNAAPRATKKAGLYRYVPRNTIGGLALYQAEKGLASRFAAAEQSGEIRPALVVVPAEKSELACLVEDLGDGRVIAMLPRSPTPMAGSLKVVSVTQVALLDVSPSDFTAVVSVSGAFARRLLNQSRRATGR
jgi:hypothetical protein